MKYALVTGSTKGIGKAIGLRLLNEGYFVIFNYSNSDNDAKKLGNEIDDDFKGKYTVIKHDLSDLMTVNLFTDKVLAITTKLDVIIFNAGITDRTVFGSISMDVWKKVFDVNLNIPFFILQALSSHIRNAGSIIFIGSMLGNLPHSVSISYGVSKAAIHSLTKNLVKFLSPNGIRVNCIAPGFVDTEWQKDKPDWLREKLKGKIALNRFAAENEVAELCNHIIENNYITGQVLQMDGGYNCK